MEEVQARIAKAAKIADRSAADVALIAVSKMHEAERIEPLLALGHREFGENRVQEAAAKWPGLKAKYPGVRLHMVGQLQSNKAAEAADLFDAIHSVDRASLVKALAKAGAASELFLQVNIGSEPQKGGCLPADLPQLHARARDEGLNVRGLMCIPPAGTEAAPYFALLRKLAEQEGLTQLSMGMSGDYETAAMLGATHIRVGTALFGARE